MGSRIQSASLKLRYSVSLLRSLPIRAGLAGSLWEVLRSRPDDVIQHQPAYLPLQDVPGLPRVLLIGDSISVGYTMAVRRRLKGSANVHRPLENCGSTTKGVESLERWLGDGPWNAIVFNFGLHDAIRAEQGPVVPIQEYSANLRSIAQRLMETKARLLWASTTPVTRLAPVPHDDMRYLEQEGEKLLGYVEADIPDYNDAANKIMSEFAIETVDLYGRVLPMRASLQIPGDIHFTRQGYSLLGDRVAQAIREQCLLSEK